MNLDYIILWNRSHLYQVLCIQNLDASCVTKSSLDSDATCYLTLIAYQSQYLNKQIHG